MCRPVPGVQQLDSIEPAIAWRTGDTELAKWKKVVSFLLFVFIANRRHWLFRQAFIACLLLRHRMDLGDVSSWKLHDDRIPLRSRVQRDKDIHSSRFCLRERFREVRHFISGHFPAIGIRKVTVSNESSQLSELGFDLQPPVRLTRLPDFDARCVWIIRNNTPMRKGKKAPHKR